jgi:hypothetical protein
VLLVCVWRSQTHCTVHCNGLCHSRALITGKAQGWVELYACRYRRTSTIFEGMLNIEGMQSLEEVCRIKMESREASSLALPNQVPMHIALKR